MSQKLLIAARALKMLFNSVLRWEMLWCCGCACNAVFVDIGCRTVASNVIIFQVISIRGDVSYAVISLLVMAIVFIGFQMTYFRRRMYFGIPNRILAWSV